MIDTSHEIHFSFFPYHIVLLWFIIIISELVLASALCLLTFARESKRGFGQYCYVAGGFRIKFSVPFVF